jgi:enoyl-CoA hydratase/carnithine racemase
MNEFFPDGAGLLYGLEPSGIATITFDRPDRLNALDWPAMDAFGSAVRTCIGAALGQVLKRWNPPRASSS